MLGIHYDDGSIQVYTSSDLYSSHITVFRGHFFEVPLRGSLL